jgi:hypothetical protein
LGGLGKVIFFFLFSGIRWGLWSGAFLSLCGFGRRARAAHQRR